MVVHEKSGKFSSQLTTAQALFLETTSTQNYFPVHPQKINKI